MVVDSGARNQWNNWDALILIIKKSITEIGHRFGILIQAKTIGIVNNYDEIDSPCRSGCLGCLLWWPLSFCWWDPSVPFHPKPNPNWKSFFRRNSLYLAELKSISKPWQIEYWSNQILVYNYRKINPDLIKTREGIITRKRCNDLIDIYDRSSTYFGGIYSFKAEILIQNKPVPRDICTFGTSDSIGE